MDFQFEPGSSSMFTRNVGASVEERGDGEETRVYAGRGAGGKLRPSRRSSLKKTTPYDRPASGRHATAGGLSASSVSAQSSSSLTSWLVGSASRWITSSATYFFPSLFSRKSLTLTNGNPASVQGTVIDEQDEEEELDPVMTQETKKDAANSEQHLAIVAVGAGSEKKDLDLAQVEDMLKQKTWSREQVSKLTDLLNARLIEHPPAISRLAEAGVQVGDAAFHAVEVTPRRAEENTSTPVSEAQRWREELKRARTDDCAPIEVARAYMGERTSSQSSLARSLRGTAHQIDRVAELQPPLGLELAEDRYRSLPVLRSWTRSPATQVPKRSSFLDEDWMSVGPMRRPRQKTFHMNSSPYARGLHTGDAVLPRTHVSPPVQSSQTARKILDTLEMLSPSPKSRLLNDEPLGALDAPMSLTQDIFNLQGRRNLHRTELSKFLSLRSTGPSNGKLEFGSPSYHPASTVGANKESNFEDKSLVDRVPFNNEAVLSNVPSGVSPKGISSTTSLLCSTAAYMSLAPSSATVVPTSASPTTAATCASAQPETKPLFSFSIPSMVGSEHHGGSGTLGLPVTVPSLSTFTTTPAVPALVMTSTTYALSTTATLKPSPLKEQHSGEKGAATEDQLKGLDATVKGTTKVSNEQGSSSFQFGSSSSLAPFSFKISNDDFAAGGLPFSSSFSSSKTNMSDSSPVNPAVSTAPVLFGSQSGTFPLFKPTTQGQLFSTSSITKPTTIHSLTIEPASAPFTFSPPPAPVSCSTPTFCFGSNSSVGQVSMSCSITVSAEAAPLSSAQDPRTGPVFSFTSPSGGPKLPIAPSEDAFKESSLPAPKFTFGRGASPPSGELSAGSASLMASFQSGAGSAPLPSPFTFSGQTASGQLFGSGAGSVLSPSSFSFGGQTATPTGLEPPASFTAGATGSEKAGRKFLKAKRRK